MKILHLSTQYKKDKKKYSNQPAKILKLLKQYKNHMECHIEGDLLLIWYDEKNDIIRLVRFGTHSELFDN
jgi:mRNA interferase YafQ